ncbi:MAG: regulatory iron-sulfur-containing complex subunit RicT, partial [Candidatus Zixiibacteriota bacterium]
PTYRRQVMAELYLVEFKGSRKEFYYNKFHHALSLDDHVIVEAERGEDIGVLVQRIDKEVDFSGSDHPGSILRPASREDIARAADLRQKESAYKKEIVATIGRHSLPMKVVDVECQFDWNKLTVFFTADHRVDFRELVKDLASQYKTRIELRQIGVRDEARRIGGFGICGQRQCCNAFMRDYAPITTQHAREQNLPLNPAKISGNCGRLLCCLRFECGIYTLVKQMFPPVGTAVKTRQGEGEIERIDIFNEEAVVRDSENRSFRVAAAEIIGTEAEETARPAPPVRAEFDDGTPDDEETREALRKLEDADKD